MGGGGLTHPDRLELLSVNDKQNETCRENAQLKTSHVACTWPDNIQKQTRTVILSSLSNHINSNFYFFK